MKGRITTYKHAESMGTITAFDSMRYGFSRVDWCSPGEPSVGLDVEFRIEGMSARAIGLRQPASGQNSREISATPATNSGTTPRQSGRYAEEPHTTWAVISPDTGFIDAVETCFRKCLKFSGRACRAEFWYFALFGFLLNMIVVVFVVFTGSDLGHPISAQLVLRAVLFLPSLAVLVRRLHDRDRSGYWVLVTYSPVLATTIYSYAGYQFRSSTPSAFTSWVLTIAGIAWMGVVVWMFVQTCIAGTLGANRYGPDPLSTSAKDS